jgi:hypothetical protein
MKTKIQGTDKPKLAELAGNLKRLSKTLKKLDESELETLDVLLDPEAMAAIREARNSAPLLSHRRAFGHVARKV